MTITTAVSVTGLPLESVLVSVVVKVVKSLGAPVGIVEVVVVKAPLESVVTTEVSVSGLPAESVVVSVVVKVLKPLGAPVGIAEMVVYEALEEALEETPEDA